MRKPVRIIWMGKDHPSLNSGYGVVGKHLLPRFAERYGRRNILIYTPVYNMGVQTEWQGMRCLAGNSLDYGENLIAEHYSQEKPTFVLHMGDWGLPKLWETAMRDQSFRVITSAPYDFLKVPDDMVQATVRFAWKIVPWTAYGYRKFSEHKLGNLESPIPLGVDQQIWQPIDRHKLPRLMASLGFREDGYNLVIVSNNQRRKYIEEALQGIGVFHKAYPELNTRLYLHVPPNGECDLQAFVDACGLKDITRFPDPYLMSQGGLPEEKMAAVFNCADVVCNVAHEGFGLAMAQAQAVGAACIYLEEGPGSEIVVYGASVPSVQADLTRIQTKALPHPLGVAAALEKCVAYRGKKSEQAIEHIRSKYTWDIIARQWFGLIDDTLLPEIERYSMEVPLVPSGKLQKAAGKLFVC